MSFIETFGSVHRLSHGLNVGLQNVDCGELCCLKNAILEAECQNPDDRSEVANLHFFCYIH